MPFPVPLYPRRIEEVYVARLLRRVRAAQTLLGERLHGVLARMQADIDARALAAAQGDAASRRDSAETDALVLLGALDAVRRAFAQAFEPDPAGLEALAGHLDVFTTRQQQRVIRGTGVDLLHPRPLHGLYQTWTAENTALLRSLDERYFAGVTAAVLAAVRTSAPMDAITAALRTEYDRTRTRARLIGTDQVGKLNGAVTQARQTSVGVRRYTWRTRRDERVRPAHRALDGRVFAWNSAPSDGHPGSAVGCRCIAEPAPDE